MKRNVVMVVAPTTVLRIVCMYCGKETGLKDGQGVEGETGGICMDCWEKRFPEFRYHVCLDDIQYAVNLALKRRELFERMLMVSIEWGYVIGLTSTAEGRRGMADSPVRQPA